MAVPQQIAPGWFIGSSNGNPVMDMQRPIVQAANGNIYYVMALNDTTAGHNYIAMWRASNPQTGAFVQVGGSIDCGAVDKINYLPDLAWELDSTGRYIYVSTKNTNTAPGGTSPPQMWLYTFDTVTETWSGLITSQPISQYQAFVPTAGGQMWWVDSGTTPNPMYRRSTSGGADTLLGSPSNSSFSPGWNLGIFDGSQHWWTYKPLVSPFEPQIIRSDGTVSAVGPNVPAYIAALPGKMVVYSGRLYVPYTTYQVGSSYPKNFSHYVRSTLLTGTPSWRTDLLLTNQPICATNPVVTNMVLVGTTLYFVFGENSAGVSDGDAYGSIPNQDQISCYGSLDGGATWGLKSILWTDPSLIQTQFRAKAVSRSGVNYIAIFSDSSRYYNEIVAPAVVLPGGNKMRSVT